MVPMSMPGTPWAASPSTTAKYGTTATVPGEGVGSTLGLLPLPSFPPSQPFPWGPHLRLSLYQAGLGWELSLQQRPLPRLLFPGLSTGPHPFGFSTALPCPEALGPLQGVVITLSDTFLSHLEGEKLVRRALGVGKAPLVAPLTLIQALSTGPCSQPGVNLSPWGITYTALPTLASGI